MAAPGQDTTDQTIAGAGRQQAQVEVDWEAAKRTTINTTLPAPVGEVPMQVEALVLALEGLEKSVAIIQDKLDPILKPGAATAAGQANSANGASEPVAATLIGERLRQAVDMVTNLRRRVADITDRTAL